LINPVRPVLRVMVKAGFVKRVKRTPLQIFSEWFAGSGDTQTALRLQRTLSVSSATAGSEEINSVTCTPEE
jgi:hypothetical protein